MSSKDGEPVLQSTVYDLILSHAHRYPENLAISHQTIQFSYADFIAKVNRLSSFLRSKGLKPGDIVPILTSRCPLMVICITAMMKMGVCYVPVEVETWSEDRMTEVLRTVNSASVISTEACRIHHPGLITREELEICVQRGEQTVSKGEIKMENTNPDDLAYMIFTSGSSGAPKGVCVARNSLEHYVAQRDPDRPFNLGAGRKDKVLLIFSAAFDACTGVIFSTLCNGGHLLISNPNCFHNDLQDCTILPCTPSLLATIPGSASIPRVRNIVLGGELPSPKLVQEWWTPSRRMFNAYGPTEATVACTISELLPNRKIVIGDPITGGGVLLLDANLEECVEGEICISGPGLAVGYFNNADLTNNKFLWWRNRRLYLTGDMGRRTLEGIIFLGRKDSLVKNRGFLINIETEVIPQILKVPDVQAAAAMMHDGFLIAFISPETVLANSARIHLQQHGDKFHVPDIVVPLPRLPLTSHGKVDTGALRKVFLKKFGGCRRGSEFVHEGVFWDAVAHALSRVVNEIPSRTSFWDLGGSSLTAIKLIAYLHKSGATISLKDLFLASDLQEASRLVRPTIVRETRSLQRNNPEGQSEKPRVAPMTLVQIGLLQPCIEEPMANYLVMVIENVNFQGDKLQEAWASALRKHPIFSTSFDLINMSQRVEKSIVLDWRETVFGVGEKAKQVDREISSLLSSLSKPNDPVCFRPSNAIRVLHEGSGSCSIVWLVHHAQVDGWSMSILMEDIDRLLASQRTLEPPDFLKYALRRAKAFDQDISRSETFWRDTVSLKPTLQELKLPPQSLKSTAIAGITSSSSQFSVSTIEIIKKCNQLRITTATPFYAAWALLLSTYTQQSIVGLGIVLSGRNAEELRVEELVGPVISSCPLIVDIEQFKQKSALLLHVQQKVLQMADEQGSLDAFLRNPGSGIDSLSAVMSTVVAIQLDLPKPIMAWAGEEAKIRKEMVYPSSLHVLVESDDDYVVTRMQYDSRKYDGNAIHRLQQHFHRIVLSLLDPTLVSINDVLGRMISAEEHQALIQKPYLHRSYLNAVNVTLKEAFELAVDQWPDSIAAEACNQLLTYSALDRQADAVALMLSARVHPLDHVAVSSDGSLIWLVTVLAVIKSGAVYVPVSCKLPKHRKKQILEQSKSHVYILAEGEAQNDMPCEIISRENVMIVMGKNHRRLPEKATSASPAYLVFTSGTTGIPKGVQIAHRQIMALINHPEARLHSRPGQRNAQTMSVGFDVSVAEIFGTLCFGATLVLQDPANPYGHLAKADAIMVTPSLLSHMNPKDYPNLRTILLAGESVPQSLVDMWAPNRRLYNGYGPCECSIVVLISRLRKGKEVTIGKTIKGTVCYILDNDRRPVPIRVSGELYISGMSVSKGYLNQREATESNFITNPFDETQLLYRTGDIASWTETMDIQYLGRIDDQVKVRGFRVELQEIELAVQQSSGYTVKEVAAIVAEENIYVFVAPSLVSTSIIHDKLTQILPHYCLPNRVIALEKLPVGPNFKVDKRELERLAVSMRQVEVRQPLSSTENIVGCVWRQVLDLGDEVHLSPSSDFYALGGNSIKQISVVRLLSKHLGRIVPLPVLFRNMTLRTLAAALRDDESTLNEGTETTHLPSSLSYLEEEIYMLHMGAQSSSAFNVVCQLRIYGQINLGFLLEAVHYVLKKEPTLRSRYRVRGAAIERFESEDITLPEILPGRESATGFLEEEINRPFDLASDQLFRCILKSLGSSTLFVLVLHHIIADKTAVNILCKRISDAYAHAVHNKHRLSACSSNFHQSMNWMKRSHAQFEHGNRDFWSQHLGKYIRIFNGQPIASLPAYSKIHSLSTLRDRALSVRNIHVAACLLAVRTTFARDDVVIGLPTSYRRTHNEQEPIGTFLDRLPVRFQGTTFKQQTTKKGLLESVISIVHEVRTNQIPHRMIMDLIGCDSIIDVMVIYHGSEDSYERNFQIPGASVHEVTMKPAWTLFPLLVEFIETSIDLEVIVTSSVEHVQLQVAETFLYSLQSAIHSLVAEETQAFM